ncbi:AMP-binding protein, partial [uncultured Shewanella sp.]|uniref:AMP-binding protein n=1 Tax=uncultured Shewanella sp. TaxID=173975 RepID=UPI00260B85C8
AEKEKLLYQWNDTNSAYPQEKTLHQAFEEQVIATPENIALVYQGEALTYRQLNERVNQLARYLRAQYQARLGEVLTPDTLI